MTLQLWWSLVSQELKRNFSYRMNFWLQFFTQTAGEVAVAYYLWKAMFESSGQVTIGGLSFSQMVSYYMFASLVGRVVRGRENFMVSSEIYEGSVTKYLLYPVSYLGIKVSEHLGYVIVALLQLLLGLFILTFIFSDPIQVFLNPMRLFYGLIAAISASMFYYLLLYTVELVAFWADNVWSLSVMARFIVAFFGGLVVPLSLMPGWVQQILDYSPFPALGYVPIRLLMGEATGFELLQSEVLLCLWSIPLLSLASVLWRAGSYRYSGVGQ